VALACLTIYRPYLFGDDGKIGHDYSYFFPYLLSGYYWFLNNGFSTPWFTPALCGGIPHFPNPQSLYYSVPQLLLYFAGPLKSVVLTYYIFGALGFLGAYALATVRFRQPLVAVFVGLSFMTNGFFLARTQAGHLSFHAFMLLPLICYLLLATTPQTAAGSQHPPVVSRFALVHRYLGVSSFFPILVAGLLLAYFIHAGASVVVVPVGFCLVFTLWLMQPDPKVWVRLALAGLFAICLSAGKLMASAYFMSLFPRDLYQLPGYENVLVAAYAALMGMVAPFSSDESNALLTHRDFLFGGEEFDYRIGFALLVACSSVFFIRPQSVNRRSVIRVTVILLVLVLPLVINTYEVDWQRLLKSLPYFSTVSSLVRWNLVYILPTIILSGWVWSECYLRWGKISDVALGIGLLIVMALPLTYGYDGAPRSYDSVVVTSAFDHAEATGEIPVILHLEESLVDGYRLSVVGTGDALTRGASQVVCNEPAFGYRLENFRFDPVFQGDTFAIHGGAYNFYRPECLQFPADNMCRPGTRFDPADAGDLSLFVSWHPFVFEQPVWQLIANGISIVTAFMLCLYLSIRMGRLGFDLLAGFYRQVVSRRL